MAKRAEQQEQKQEQQESDQGYVRYIGASQTRSMSKQDLEEAGLSGNDLVDLVWSRENNWTIARADIPDAVYERAIVPDLELVYVSREGHRIK
jgi:hypothetical protein